MTSAELLTALGDRLKHTHLIVVANREPYIHLHRTRLVPSPGLWARLRRKRVTEEVTWIRPASGLVTALDPVMRACGGTWVAHGSGSADREVADSKGRVRVPPDNPAYTLRRVWLTEDEEAGYYYGLSNNAIWPLCHIAYARPEFNESDWAAYSRVNRRFAETVLDEIGSRPAIVFVQDYHFALLPRFIKDARPDVVVCQFWHIPWPNPEAFRVCPWAEEILHGLLGNDLLSFHIQYHCNNFLDTVERTLEARVDYERFAVVRGGHPTLVKPFPISIDPELWAHDQDAASDARAMRKSLGLGRERIIFGVDRLDYTKGIPDRLRAFERMLKRHPEWRERVVFVQVGAPSRDQLRRYQALSREVDETVTSVNETYRHQGLAAGGLPARASRAAGHRGDVPCRRRLRRLIAARRDEPGGEGVHRVAHRPPRGARALATSPAPRASSRKRCWSTRMRWTSSPTRCTWRCRCRRSSRRGGCGRCTRACRTRPCTTGRPASCGRRAEWPLPSD